ncbi:hypothetical protein SI65_08271 [Aspergillus cristatus]|uniref:Uncharacterized protein n=1 Tax=Aspergillus cristatus TaxID=573508 RepID=A0A1E3B5P3_ASPCR|nr:hypothetical protein SI65_08271 [Aspergillus cristatus]
MLCCTSKFDSKDETVYVEEFLSHNEIGVEKEAKEDDPDELGIKQTSDTEEGYDQGREEGEEEGEDDETEATEPQLPAPEGNTQC